MLTSFMLTGLCLSGSDFFISVPASPHFPWITLIIPHDYFNSHVDYTLRCPEGTPPARASLPPLSRRAAWKPGAPRVPRRRPRAGAQSPWVPAGGGAREAGVPNDSPALQPGEVLARAPLPHYRWGRAFWPLLGVKTFPGRRRWRPHCWLGPPGALQLPIAGPLQPRARSAGSFLCSHWLPSGHLVLVLKTPLPGQ